MTTQPTTPTPAAIALDALARSLAQRNPDAAEELGRRLVHHAARERKRVAGGLAIVIRLNPVTGRIEMSAG